MLSAPEKKRYEGFDNRLKVLGWVLCLVACVLVFQLGNLQIAQGDIYAGKAERNRLRSITLRSQRGAIYGRDKSVVLAGNRAACDLYLVPAECKGSEKDVCTRLVSLVDIDAADLTRLIQRFKREVSSQVLFRVDTPGRVESVHLLQLLGQFEKEPFTQIPIKLDISRSELARVEEMAYALPGVFTVARPQRRYLYGKTAGQIMGWLNEVDDDDLKAMPEYRMGDLIGRAGIERAYESLLRGRDGQMVVTLYNQALPQMRTDAFGEPQMAWDQRGRQVNVEYRVEPISGRSVFLTLDMALQAKAEDILQDKRGAIVVLNANTGEIYALASSPGYDPNVFADSERRRERYELLTSGEELKDFKRMRHRAFQERYPPGSAFKVMMAVAGLEEGVITEHSTFGCVGHFNLGRARWGCWRPGGHGRVAIVDALTFSCDVFFYNVGLGLGIEKIDKWAALMGLGELSGIDLPNETRGLMPSPEWKWNAPEYSKLDPGSRRWQKGETVNVAIGQGQCALTPLQLAVMTAAIVNGGRRVRPYVNAEQTPQVSEPFIHEKTLAIVREGMRRCVAKHDAPSGTGKLADIEGMHIIGKTGTAQVVNENFKEESQIPYKKRAHAWFVAGVLDREPPIALCVLYEHGLHGSSGAAPLAKEIIEYFYKERAQSLVQVARREDSP